MRYWINGEDEDYERELERVTRFGGELPGRMSGSTAVAFSMLVGLQVALGVGIILLLLGR